jgi:LCP family protein required for cell wall assembly
MVVNPKTRDIILVNTPRDYYVQLHGIKGQKDKLTHAGYVGGVKLSKATLEDLLGYKADYYVRVNFDAVVRLVDALGGIRINNDVGYSVTPKHGQGCVLKPGWNNVDGICALGFARERYSYRGGDRQRGKNQQQVIKRVIEKVSSSKTLVMNYNKLLNAMKGTFETDLSTKNITSIVQFQLNDMRGWNITTANLDGPTGMTSTYTCPNCKRSVMYQNKKSIDAAKAKIKEVLEKE